MKVSSRQRKSYRRSVLHRAALAVPSLPPPNDGSLRHAALVCVQQLQGASALPGSTQSTNKRPFPDSPNALVLHFELVFPILLLLKLQALVLHLELVLL